MTQEEIPYLLFAPRPKPEPMTDEQLFEMMKSHPEFENLPKPATWFKKFNLPPVKARNFKEYLIDDAYMEARGKIVTEKAIYSGPQPGGVRPVPPPEIIPMEIISRPLQPESASESTNVLLDGSTVAPQEIVAEESSASGVFSG